MNPISSSYSSVGVPSAADSGLAAIATGTQKSNQDAQQVANPQNPNVAGPLADSKQALLLTEAGAAVLRTSDKMLGTLLDALA